MGESLDCLLLSETVTVVGGNPDHVCWEVRLKPHLTLQGLWLSLWSLNSRLKLSVLYGPYVTILYINAILSKHGLTSYQIEQKCRFEVGPHIKIKIPGQTIRAGHRHTDCPPLRKNTPLLISHLCRKKNSSVCH